MNQLEKCPKQCKGKKTRLISIILLQFLLVDFLYVFRRDKFSGLTQYSCWFKAEKNVFSFLFQFVAIKKADMWTMHLNYGHCAVSEIKSINKYFTLNSFLFGISHSTQLSCRFSSISIAFDYTQKRLIGDTWKKQKLLLAMQMCVLFMRVPFLWFNASLSIRSISIHMNR